MIDLTQLLDLPEKMDNLFTKLKGKLMNDPDKAAEKLALVVMEVSKIYAAIDAELVKFLTLNFTETNDMREEMKVLYNLQGPAISIRVNEARGHCHKISRIYESYMNKWLSKLLVKEDINEGWEIFYRIDTADSEMVRAIDELENWMTEKTDKVVDFIHHNNITAASEVISNAYYEVAPVRKQSKDAQRIFSNLEIRFEEIAGLT